MLRNVAVVMRGTVLAQIIGVLVLPVLSRHFSPGAFGQFQLYQSILGALLIVATLRYEVVILRVETPRELGAVIFLCAATNILIAILMFVANFISGKLFNYSFYDKFGISFYLIIIAFIFGGVIQYIGYFLTREGLFNASSNAKIIQSGTSALISLVLALTRPFLDGIVWGDIMGRVTGGVASLALGSKGFRLSVARPSREDILRVARTYWRYPTISAAGGLVNVIGTTITPIMIYHQFDAATSGQFGLLQRGAALPIGLIGTSISQVYMSHLAADMREARQDAFRHYCRLMILLLVVCVPPAIVMELFAQPLFAYVFGSGWSQAALFAQLMMPCFCASLLSSAIGMTLIVTGWQKTQFAWEATRLASMVAFWVGGTKLDWSANAMVAGHSAILTISSILTVVLSGLAVKAAVRSGGISEAAMAKS